MGNESLFLLLPPPLPFLNHGEVIRACVDADGRRDPIEKETLKIGERKEKR